jgi:DNA topoisomerase-3
MPKILVIAEKPSMGRDIADALGLMLRMNVTKGELCQYVGDYIIVGAQGHLFSLVDGEHYGAQFAFPWRIEALPVLPQEFVIEPNFQKVHGKVVNNDLTKSIRARIARIKVLIADADEVVHAGDPDREGQLIIDDVLRHVRFKGPVRRLWLHAQTCEGIQDAWRKMRDNKTYANLGIAAVARRESDWAIGINATRAYSALWWKKGHKGVLNIGRVVTPVVGMIVQREKDIRAFVPIDHFTLKAQINIGDKAPFVASWIKPIGEGRPEFDPSGKLIINRSMVSGVAQKCHGKMAIITVSEKSAKKESPPLLFSLVDLQKMAAKMGHSPEDVLTAAQSLYEKHKLLSYPRTECQYAPESEWLHAGDVISAITRNFSGSWTIADGWDPQRRSRAWDDKKLAEHFAILPLKTTRSVANLGKIERDVYRLVCRQYLAQFFPAYEYMAATVVADVAGERFKATGKAPTQEGWRAIYGGAAAAARRSDGEDESQDGLPNLSVGEKGVADPIELLSKKTEPPKRFTAITLLEAMEKVHLFVTDPKVKAQLKSIEGLGTAATRAATISKVVTAGFAVEERAGKVISYAPTAKAFAYIESVPDALAKPDLTAWFEGKLEELKGGTLAYDRYRILLAKLVGKAIEAAKDGSALMKMPGVQDMPAVPVARKRGTRKRRS